MSEVTGTIQLTPIVVEVEPEFESSNLLSTELHLTGQHDQSSHGKGKGGGGGGGEVPTDAQMKKRVATATEVKLLAGGKSGARVEYMKGPNGKVVHKTKTGLYTTDSEYLAWKVGEALGSPVRKIVREDDHAIIMDFVPGRMAGGFSTGVDRVVPIPGERIKKRDTVERKGARELALLDIAINNKDRHGGNIIIKPDGSVLGIDHSAFVERPVFNPATTFEDRWAKSFTKTEFREARSKIQPLKKEFDKLGRTDWWEDMDRELGSRERRASRP